MKTTLTTGVAALGLALAACGSNEEAMQNQDNIASSETNTMMADPNNPFAGAMQQMMDQMMAAVGSNVGQNWARKMIVHHQGAIDMSRIVLEQNPTPEVAKLARDTIDKQGKEIEEIRKLLEEGPPDQQSAAIYRPGMMEMQQKMMAASGDNISETFLRKMLEHHKGAVTMSDVALAKGVTGALRDQVRKTRDAQVKEIAMTESMLRGEPMAEAKQGAEERSSNPAPSSERQGASAPQTRTTPSTPRPTRSDTASSNATAPAEQPDPHAGHDMNNMQH